ncbi:phytoene synthase [Streptomyces spiroverticillatus]|uniref:Phytoene synthase n=1 Tax=Streptomyces finlayi TaxID=67296 RepID=A0A918X9I0_9ACTN|nr:phytoene/squalene synthase family protein [Streptomyces finlayi]GHA47268.1 phytoene synthase [Streptomyces spiroverticillatus]GHD18605.1 phytoene synthase [Streptomyces finlayi]
MNAPHAYVQNAPDQSIRNTPARYNLNATDRHILDAAGLHDPRLRAAYAHCRRLHARHGRTYYLATLLLPPAKRPYVHALYGFARHADEIVDNEPEATRTDHFTHWSAAALAALTTDAPADPATLALRDTVRRWDIPLEHVTAFLASMRADLTVTDYPTFEDLNRYMYGSAAVIGLQMVPLLEPLCPEAHPRAQAMGEAFQLSNFIRDIAEDLARGRVYLPAEDLALYGVTRTDLARTRTNRAVRDLLRHEIDRNRKLYAYAVGGIRMLHPSSRPCVETAHTLYSGILEAVEDADYEILDRRVHVPLPTRLKVALPAYTRARRLRGSPA